MKKLFTHLLGGVCAFFLFMGTVLAQQNIQVKGRVTDATNGEALIGVSIKVKGSNQGTSTDMNGAFTISVPTNATLVYSYIGYEPLETPVNNQTTLNVKMSITSSALSEVVVVGYGSQRKVDVTGSVSQVKGEEISKQASINPVGALQGKVAGVQITNQGAPGASPQITIRGTGTIYGNTNILYVVDGVWYDNISFLNPADIDNLSVLKDASSTAIYGLRAANGVVLITTKRGKKGTATVNYNAYAGWQSVTNPLEMANGTEYASLINELYDVNGTTPLLFSNPSSFGEATDWYGQVLRDAFVTNHQISISGGAEKSNYNFSLGYLDQDGNVKTNNYKRYTVRLVNDYQPYEFIKLGYSVGGLYSNSNDINGSIFNQLYGAAPIVPVYYADGSYGDPSDFNLGGGNNYNPQVTLDFFNQKSKNYRFTGNVYAEINFLKNFTFKTSFGGDIGQAEVRGYSPIYKATLIQQSAISRLNISRTEERNWIAENTLTYANKIEDHNFTVLLGQTAQRYKSYNINGSAQNVPYNSEGDLYLALGDVAGRNITDGGSLTTALSYFGRINYSYKDKYLLNGSLRADAGSQFYGNNLWAYLPSVGAGWVISNESFMKGQEIFNTLKLRASWGKVGNAGVPINPTTQVVTQTPQLTAIFGGVPYTGASINTIVPPAILVERAVGTDVGLEAALLKNRLTVEFGYYSRKTSDAIFSIPVLTSIGTGSSSIIGNQADFRNRGFEFMATWRGPSNKDFSYSVSGNLGINDNKVISVVTGSNPIYAGGEGIANGARATRTVLGSPIGEFFGYQVDGIFQNTAEVAASAQTTAKPGDFRYADINDDGIIDGKDRVPLGNPNPKYSYGINTTFNYKNFDLALDFQGVAGVDVYNAKVGYRFGNENFTKDFYDNRWHGSGTSTTYPSANIGSTTNAAPNSFYVEDGSYFRVRNAQLGYLLPSSMLSKFKIQRVRIYANAQNALNFFKYKGFNPEVGGSPTNAGIDNNVYPLYATYNFGINVTF